MIMTKKLKVTCASLLAVCCAGTSAAGLALTKGRTASAASADDSWIGVPGQSAALVGDEVLTLSANAAITNKGVDITKLPGSTGVFYMYYTSSIQWSGFSLRNGNEACGYSWNMSNVDATSFPWHSVCFEGQNNHMILNDTRTFTGDGSGTHGGINGTGGENFLSGMVPVEIHLGQGTSAGDASYIKIGGTELIHESSENLSVTQVHSRTDTGTSKELVSSAFAQGAYLSVNWNGSGTDPLFAITEPGSVLALNPSMDATEQNQQRSGNFNKDLTMDLSSAADVFTDGCKVTMKVNGKEISGVEVKLDKTDSKTAKLTVTKENLNKIPEDDLASVSFITFSFTNDDKDYGDVAVALNIVFEDPPVLDSDEIALESVKDFSVSFEYSGKADPLTETKVSYQPVPSAAETELTSTDDFSVKKDETSGKYTINVTQTGAEKIFDGHTSAILTIRLRVHKLRVTAYVQGSSDEFGIRFRAGIDYADGSLKQDGFYSSATIKKHNPQTLSSRVFYENSVDVTKPIFLEYSTLDESVEWMLVSLMDTPAISEYFSNDTGPDQGNVFSFIMFGNGKSQIQGMNGAFTNGNTAEFKQNTNMKNNVVEISLGAEKASDGYVKVNGEQISRELAKSQKDFKNGKAWVGLFFNNQTNFDFTVNTHVNAVAIGSPQEDSAYKMDLGKAADFTLELSNTSGNLKLTDESGSEIPSSQFTYDNGTLTIKAEYFAGRSYSKEGQIFIWDNDNQTGTAFRMSYTDSDMGAVQIAFATKGALGDVTFDFGVKEVSRIESSEGTVPSENYTVRDGKLVLLKAALKDEAGVQQFLVTADGTVYPCYVYVDEFKDGLVLSGGAAATGNGFTLTGNDGKATQARVYNLSEGFRLGFNFKSIDTYHERGVNEAATSVTLRFFDPMSGNTLVISVYANFPDDRISSSMAALYLSAGLYDADGGKVADGVDRPIAPSDGNNSASGEHNIELAVNDGKIRLTVAGRPYDFTFQEFNMNAVIFSITAEHATSGSSTETVLGGYNISDPSNPGGGDQPGDQPGEPSEPGEADNGCGSVIGGTGIALAVIAVLGAAVAVIFAAKKKEK